MNQKVCKICYGMFAAVLFLAGVLHGQPPVDDKAPLVKETNLEQLALKILDESIPKDLLSPDGNWSPLDVQDARKEYSEKTKGKSWKVIVKCKLQSVAPSVISLPDAAGKLVKQDGLRVECAVIKWQGKFKFRGKDMQIEIPSEVTILLPLSEKPKLQKVVVGTLLYAEGAISAWPNGDEGVIYGFGELMRLQFNGRWKMLELKIPVTQR